MFVGNIAIIGAGRAGKALALALNSKGYKVNAVASRSFSSAQGLSRLVDGCKAYNNLQEAISNAKLVFITVPDRSIREVAESLDWEDGQFVVHSSGAFSRDLLNKAELDGAVTGVFHPLQTLAEDSAEACELNGITFAIEAKQPLYAYLEDMARNLGGSPMEVGAEYKPLYHASAVMAGNYLVALLNNATDMWAVFGIKRSDALRALAPLVKKTLENSLKKGIPEALTGPISRGDEETIKSHLKSIRQHAEHTSGLYSILGMNTIPLAVENGTIDKNKAKRLNRIFKENLDTYLGGFINENNVKE